jgi:4Fe-4S ferredoxin
MSCSETPAAIRPVIDRNRCEAKAECVRVCPYNVFAVRGLAAHDKAGMSFVGRVKALVHGNRQAFVERPEACHACGLCVSACPEGAITLQKGD